MIHLSGVSVLSFINCNMYLKIWNDLPDPLIPIPFNLMAKLYSYFFCLLSMSYVSHDLRIQPHYEISQSNPTTRNQWYLISIEFRLSITVTDGRIQGGVTTTWLCSDYEWVSSERKWRWIITIASWWRGEVIDHQWQSWWTQWGSRAIPQKNSQ